MTERKIGVSQNKRGRKKRLELNEDLFKTVELLTGRGLAQHQIAAYYGISVTTLERYKNKCPELEEAFRKGRVKTLSYVAGKLIEQINQGSTAATIFYLKCQGRWKDPNAASNRNSDDEQEENKAPQSLKTGTKDPNEASKIYQQIMLGE